MSETERLKEIAWRKQRRGLRWNILRDIVAVCSLKWMDTSEVQDVMLHIHGITHTKTVSLLAELERPGFVIQERDERDKIYKWGTTPKGVKSWLPMGKMSGIPAGIVQAVEISRRVKESEA